MQSKITLFLVAVAIGNVAGYWFPNGPPHRPARQLDVNETFPEPKVLLGQEPRTPSFMMKATRKVQAPGHVNAPKAQEPRDMGLQLVPHQEALNTKSGKQSSRCQMTYAFGNAGESATFQSPDYPEDYPNDVDSTICFSSPSGTTMQVTCDDFNVEYQRSCSYDYLGLGFGGDPTSVQKYCGQGTLKSRQTSANRLAVRFVSDYSNPGGSNRQPYRFTCRVQVSGDGSTTTTTTNSPGNCQCGKRNDQRIVGGQESKMNEFPWRCYLRTNQYSFFCGCSVISNNWILTAAHCTQAVMPLDPGDKLYAVVGRHNRQSSTETASQQIEIEAHYDHPDYNDQTYDNDMSLLKLSRQVSFTREISPVCLPWNYPNDEFDGETVSASGWGTTSQGGSVSNTLREVDLPVLTTQQCRQYYPGQITDNMICTYNPGKDTCQGDSGGSIDLNRDGNYYAIGVVSWGYGCAQRDNPGVYAKTNQYLNWITETTQGEDFCRA